MAITTYQPIPRTRNAACHPCISPQIAAERITESTKQSQEDNQLQKWHEQQKTPEKIPGFHTLKFQGF
jgi:hypothetical protein